MGCAEACVKCPATLTFPAARKIIDANKPLNRNDSAKILWKKSLKWLLGSAVARAALLWGVEQFERVCHKQAALAPIYRGVLGLHFYAGVRHGLRSF
jgi:hypothetical protein